MDPDVSLRYRLGRCHLFVFGEFLFDSDSGWIVVMKKDCLADSCFLCPGFDSLVDNLWNLQEIVVSVYRRVRKGNTLSDAFLREGYFLILHLFINHQ